MSGNKHTAIRNEEAREIRERRRRDKEEEAHLKRITLYTWIGIAIFMGVCTIAKAVTL